jgi:hypothetical protein
LVWESRATSIRILINLVQDPTRASPIITISRHCCAIVVHGEPSFPLLKSSSGARQPKPSCRADPPNAEESLGEGLIADGSPECHQWPHQVVAACVLPNVGVSYPVFMPKRSTHRMHDPGSIVPHIWPKVLIDNQMS